MTVTLWGLINDVLMKMPTHADGNDRAEAAEKIHEIVVEIYGPEF